VSMDLPVPAFANCTLDGNPGDGDLRNGETFSAVVNGYVLWESTNIVDAADSFQITLRVDASSYYPDCLVDMTPRRCRKFRPPAGRRFLWTNTLAEQPPDFAPQQAPAAGLVPRVVQTGTATADAHGLVTLEKIAVTKGRHRIEIRAQ